MIIFLSLSDHRRLFITQADHPRLTYATSTTCPEPPVTERHQSGNFERCERISRWACQYQRHGSSIGELYSAKRALADSLRAFLSVCFLEAPGLTQQLSWSGGPPAGAFILRSGLTRADVPFVGTLVLMRLDFRRRPEEHAGRISPRKYQHILAHWRLKSTLELSRIDRGVDVRLILP